MDMKLMRGLVAITALGIALATPSLAFAQQGSTVSRQVNVSQLPVSLQRIQKAIQQSSSAESREALRLHYQVDVYGKAPDLAFFENQGDLIAGPVPHTAPTHNDMLYQWTPQEYRAPAADLNSLWQWIADKTNRR
jgi:hypothetical protein